VPGEEATQRLRQALRSVNTIPAPRRRRVLSRSHTVSNESDIGRLLFDRLSLEVDGQDARTGRLLTAVAFFLTSGVAGLNLSFLRNSELKFSSGSLIPVPLFADGCFLLLQIVAATYLILSLGPPEPPLRNYHDTNFSLTRIVILRQNDWDILNRLRGGRLARTVGETYERDTRYLQDKAVYKYQRLVEARASLLLSLPFLLLAICYALLSTAGSKHTVLFSVSAALPGASILWLLTFLTSNDRLRIEGHYDVLRVRDPNAVHESLALRVLVRTEWGFAFYSAIIFLGSGIVGSPYWTQWILGSISVAVLGPQFFAMRARRREARKLSTPQRALDRFGSWWVAFLGGVGFILITGEGLRIWCLAYSLTPILITEGIRLVDFVFNIDPALDLTNNL
jgi:hypothetical protein